jgi:hypothetical protein
MDDDLVRRLQERIDDAGRRTTLPTDLGLDQLERAGPTVLGQALGRLSRSLGDLVARNREGAPVWPAVPADVGVEGVSGARPARRPPVSAGDIAAAESGLGVTFPAPFRQLYLGIADGGVGPGTGLLSLTRVVEATLALRTGDALPRGRAWPSALVAIVEGDPGWDCLDTATGQVVTWDPLGLHERSDETAFARSFRVVAQDLGEWLEGWLAAPTLEEEVTAGGGRLVRLSVGGLSFPAAIGPTGWAGHDAGGSSRAAGPSPTRRTTAAPAGDATQRVLAKVAGRIQADAAGAIVDASAVRDGRGLDPALRSALNATVERVSPERLAWHVPRRSNGAPDPKAILALRPFGPDGRRLRSLGRRARVRASRADGRLTFRLAIEELISENESHRWVRAPWCWDGTDVTPLARQWGGTLEELRSTLDALDAGRWTEALAPWDVEVDDQLDRLLAGDHAAPDLADLTEAWTPRLAAAMRRLAPWRLAEAVERALRGGKPIRLVGLGGVTQQRKPGIILSRGSTGPRLGLAFSASNERVPEAAWTRPLTLDLVHAGQILAAAVPAG